MHLYVNESDAPCFIGREMIAPRAALLVRTWGVEGVAFAMRFRAHVEALAFAVGANLVWCVAAYLDPATGRHKWLPRAITHYESELGHVFSLADTCTPEWIPANNNKQTGTRE